MLQCKILIQLWNLCTKKKEVPESVTGRCSLSILLYSVIKGEHWPEIKLDNQYPKECKYEVVLKFSKISNQVQNLKRRYSL